MVALGAAIAAISGVGLAATAAGGGARGAAGFSELYGFQVDIDIKRPPDTAH